MPEFLLDLIKIKYPAFPSRVSEYQSRELVKNHTFFALDYKQELGSILEKKSLGDFDHIIQFPFRHISTNEKTKEELELQEEKRRENAKNLQKIAARIRQEKLERKEIEIVELQSVLDQINDLESTDSNSVRNLLRDNDFDSKEELEAEIKKIEGSLKRARYKDLGIDPNEDKEPPKLDLLEVPDDQLDQDQLKEKRKQKLIKSNLDARDRIRQAKLEEKRKQEEEIKKDLDLKTNNFEVWLKQLKDKRQSILDKIEAKNALKSELSNRRSQASQIRLRNIADLASNESNNSGSKRKRQEEFEDNFGEDDNDWNIYLDISKENLEDEEDDPEAELIQINELLFENDPEYLNSLDRMEKDKIENTILYRFYSGDQEAILEKPAVPKNSKSQGSISKNASVSSNLDNSTCSVKLEDSDVEIDEDTASNNDYNNNNGSSCPPRRSSIFSTELDEVNELIARSNQIHLNVERVRVPEILFQPSIFGIDQGGLVEAIENLWKNVPGLLPVSAKNIFITGQGFSKTPGLQDRLRKELTSILPVGTPLNIFMSTDLESDAWRGAAAWTRFLSNGANHTNYINLIEPFSISRVLYNECGSEYLKENAFSNKYHNFS
ncbi:hypothetical protein BB560_002670 [Smittium megazygosporum]|nr:hypothetical protein BB560_002670 [Smittium megazygosporum]